jgi:hypothetical protein
LDDWAARRERRFIFALAAQPEQRLAWLEERIALAEKTNVLPKTAWSVLMACLFRSRIDVGLPRSHPSTTLSEEVHVMATFVRRLEEGISLLAVGALAFGAAGCVAVGVAGAVAGLPGPVPRCQKGGDHAVRRAAREFSCSPEKVGVIRRTDISDDLYELDACGQRARYACFSSRSGESEFTTRCIREPDPVSWDPDPRMVASLPKPEKDTEAVRCPPGESRRVCRDKDDLNHSRDCIMRLR